jgi:hypothetical protein
VCEREERENFVLNFLTDFEPVKRFKNRRNEMKFRNFGDSMSSLIEKFADA